MYDYYFSYRTMISAQQAAEMLRRHGIEAAFVRSPKSASPGGCGYAARVHQRDAYAASNILRTAGLLYERISQTDLYGRAREVIL